VSSAEIDFSEPDAELEDLLQEIRLLPGGTRYYTPAKIHPE